MNLKSRGKGNPRGDRKAWKTTWSSASVGIEIALCIIVGLLGGRWLDGHFGTDPWLMIVGFVAGAVAAGRALWRVVKHELRDGDADGEAK
jgi:F0F1-type ATP synthase assembly protein I